MSVTRRNFTIGAAAAGASAFTLARPAIAQSSTIKIGWPAAMTGPASASTIGYNRGLIFAAQAMNAAGGVKGRQIEIFTRDTQGDPSKAVNAVQEMISQIKTHAIYGPSLSGETLAVTPIIARGKMPHLHGSLAAALIDPVKYPTSFRIAPYSPQWDDAASNYVLEVMKAKKVAIIADTSGYGVTALKSSVETFNRDMKNGAALVYQASIDPTATDVTPDMTRARNAGAEAIVVWTPSVGLAARLMNTRAAMGWDVPLVGHTQMSDGSIAGLLDKKSNWEKVYTLSYRNCCLDKNGKVAPHTQELVDRLKGKVELSDTLLFLVAQGVDAIDLIAKAVIETGSTDSADFVKYWNSLSSYNGYFSEYSFSPTEHNGYPTRNVVMAQANSNTNGSPNLAPGYS
jgi:branched-chain amino acid transport system substrate-binding protein